MGGSVLIWVIVIFILIIIFAIHLARCCKAFESKTQNDRRVINRRVIRTITIPTRGEFQPYTISNNSLQTDIEQGLHMPENVRTHHSQGNNFLAYNQSAEVKDDVDPPSYEEAIAAQNLQKTIPQATSRPVAR